MYNAGEGGTMPFSRILLDKTDGVARITLNRADSLNAIDRETLLELAAASAEIEQDQQVRVAVITGAGRAFCAGADLNYILGTLEDPLKTEQAIRLWHGTFTTIENISKPVIAAVNGLALAGGLELVAVCDLAVAAENAKLGDQHANFGLVPGGGGSQRLPRLIGVRRAKELLLTGRWLSAAEALDIGLVNRVAPAGKLEELVREITDDLVKKKSPMASRMIKGLVNRGMQADLATGLELEVQGILRHFSTEDCKEGIAAFREKRPPVFKGR